jgi:hypothetical protein
MLASAVAAGLSTYLHWLPCRGSMLRGSIIYDFAYVGPKFSAACERRMSGDQGPWELALYVLAVALAGVAWLTLVLGLRWQRRTKRVAALPGLATLALAGATAIGDAVFGQDGEILMLLLVSIDLSAVVALIAILAWEPDVRVRSFLRLVVVLWGTTAFGASHVMAEYAIMIKFSDANWDSPPGTGYLTVAVITISAILTAIMALRTPQRGVEYEPHQDHHSGSLTLA